MNGQKSTNRNIRNKSMIKIRHTTDIQGIFMFVKSISQILAIMVLLFSSRQILSHLFLQTHSKTRQEMVTVDLFSSRKARVPFEKFAVLDLYLQVMERFVGLKYQMLPQASMKFMIHL